MLCVILFLFYRTWNPSMPKWITIDSLSLIQVYLCITQAPRHATSSWLENSSADKGLSFKQEYAWLCKWPLVHNIFQIDLIYVFIYVSRMYLYRCHVDTPLIHMFKGQLEPRSWPHTLSGWSPFPCCYTRSLCSVTSHTLSVWFLITNLVLVLILQCNWWRHTPRVVLRSQSDQILKQIVIPVFRYM